MKTITFDEAIKFIKDNELENVSWVVWAAACLKAGYFYDNPVLQAALYKINYMYNIKNGSRAFDNTTDVDNYNMCFSSLCIEAKKQPITSALISGTVAESVKNWHGSDEVIMNISRILCFECGVEFDEKQCLRIINRLDRNKAYARQQIQER